MPLGTAQQQQGAEEETQQQLLLGGKPRLEKLQQQPLPETLLCETCCCYTRLAAPVATQPLTQQSGFVKTLAFVLPRSFVAPRLSQQQKTMRRLLHRHLVDSCRYDPAST